MGRNAPLSMEMIAEQYSSIYRMQKASLPTEIMSEQNWNIYSMQKIPTFNKNDCQGGFRHLEWAEMLQCQWKTEASAVCRNAPLWTEIIAEWDSGIYSMQKCATLNGKNIRARSKHWEWVEMLQLQQKLFLSKIQAFKVRRNALISTGIMSEQEPGI